MARKRRRRKQRSSRSTTDRQVSIEHFVAGRRDEGELSEDDALEMAWEMHPDLNQLRLDNALPDEMVDGEGNVWSPRMHIDMHAIVERQLANGEPDGMAALAIRFEREKELDSHEIRHVLAAALAEQIWYMSKEGCPFDSERYFCDIERVYEKFLKAKN